jgi:hypothetical protein
MTKEERIKAEFERISVFFSEIPPNQREFIEPLLQNAAFMKTTLEDLQDIINIEGVEDEYKNGANQYGTKPSAVLQAYNTMLKNYAAVKLKLIQLLPKQATVSRLKKMFDE